MICDIKIFIINTSYKIFLSYEVNMVNVESCQHEGGCFPRGFNQSENNLSRVDNLMFTSYEFKAITVLLHRNYSKLFMTWMFCFAEDNNIISGK